MQPRKGRDVLLLVLVGAALAASLVMIHRALGVASPWFGLALMFDVTGVAAFARPLANPWLPGFLRKTYPWEAKGPAYGVLRVPAFGELLRHTALRKLNTNVYFDENRDRAGVIASLEWAEMAHLLAAVALVPWLAIAHVHGSMGTAIVLWTVQVAYNVYPVLHLRWVRARLIRLAGRRRKP